MENQIESKTSEELGLLLQQQYEQMFVIQANIRALSQELGKRHERHTALDKGTEDVSERK